MKGPEAMDEQVRLLSQAYREAARAEPGPALDARILAAAHQATLAKPASRHTGIWRWLVPASSLAVLVLALGVVLRVQQEAPESVGVEADLRRAPAAADIPAARLSEKSAAAPAPEGAPRADTASADETLRRPSAQPAEVAEVKARARRGAPEQAEATANRADPVPMAPRAGQTEPAEQPGLAMPHGASDAVAKAPAAPASSLRAAPTLEGHAEALQAPRAASPAPLRHKSESVPAYGGAALDAAPAMAMKRAPRLENQAAVAEPEAAIEAIRARLRAGRIDEARQLLREFMARYPGYALPEDIQALRRSGAPGATQ